LKLVILIIKGREGTDECPLSIISLKGISLASYFALAAAIRRHCLYGCLIPGHKLSS
jgi:hypothetical protein